MSHPRVRRLQIFCYQIEGVSCVRMYIAIYMLCVSYKQMYVLHILKRILNILIVIKNMFDFESYCIYSNIILILDLYSYIILNSNMIGDSNFEK